jgi:NAD(P)-dependent dehydrogenase (short-subunit alcohol dehydrogenase family)
VSVPAASDIQGRHAVVTGGSRGIGAAIAAALASQEVKITLMARTSADLDRAARTLVSNAGIHAVPCDVTNPDDVRRAFASAVETFGDVGILINNAGQAEAASFETMPFDLWNRLIAVNLTGTFLCTQQVLAPMIRAGSGRIVNVASTAGLTGYARLAAYTASKHGVVGLTRSLAAETARTGVTVNAVCPGYTEGTEMLSMAVSNVMRDRGVSADEARALLTKRSPRGTLITPREVADTVLWLCSSSASAITGQAIAVAAGEVM